MTHTPVNPEYEQQPTPSDPIAALLPRYYEVLGDNPSFVIERSFTVDRHEVAWLQYTGTTEVDILGLGREGQPYDGHELQCACYFTEDIGWRTDDTYGAVYIHDGTQCDKKETVVHLLQDELRQTYIDSGRLTPDVEPSIPVIKEILLDLIKKHQAEVFIEDSTGAEFWGGHYYLQSAGQIIGVPMKQIWQAADELVAEKHIQIDGAVVKSYKLPHKAPMYESPDVSPDAHVHHEKPNKIWALVPRPDMQDIKLDSLAIDDRNRKNVIGSCIVGLAHTPELALQRLREAITRPRISHERLYQYSFVETSQKVGTLAVIAYSASHNEQPEEWVVEGFIDDAIAPEVHTLPMDYPTKFGIDQSDYTALEVAVNKWWPQ